jgi:transcriptional regulator with PAS, ATPase and Fis domain
MAGSLGFFVVVPLLFDFVFPVIYNYNIGGSHPHFMLWYQYSYIFLTMICGQYFTSVSFKNKSAWWFLNGFVRYMGDCVVYFDSKGHILFANPASQQIFQLSDSDIATVNVQQLLPDIDTQQEATYTNVKVKIKNELHTFNVGIFKLKQSLTTSVNVLLLSDQTNLLFYQQRI